MDKGNSNVSCPKFKRLKNILRFPVVLSLVLISCDGGSSKERSEISSTQKKDTLDRQKDSVIGLRDTLLKMGYCDVSVLDSSIWYDLKYTGSDNFMKMKLYNVLDRPFLQCDIARRLVRCSEYLRSLDTSLHLFIYDAVRPLDVQCKMWYAMDSLPPKERVKFVSNPAHKSLHNYGAAIDITICKSDRSVLDMGAGFDDIRKIAYPSLEKHFLETKELTQEQWRNRLLLRQVMRAGNFSVLPSEWWHFNACSRWEAKSKYLPLEKEQPIQ
jgi:D-alanyl-D-alanine dipeptidase